MEDSPAPVMAIATAFPLPVILRALDATYPPMATSEEPVHKRHGRQSAEEEEDSVRTIGFRVVSPAQVRCV